MVGEVDDHGVAVQAERLDLLDQVPDPAVDQHDLGGVEGADVVALGLGHVVRSAVAGHDQPVADVGRIGVARLVVRRGVERLVGIPHVDPEDEAVLVAVLLEPVHRGRDGPAAHPVALEAALGDVAQVAVDGRVGLDLARRGRQRELARGGQVAVGVLAAHPLPALEAARVVVVVVAERRGVEDQGRQVAVGRDDLRQDDVVRLERLPAAERKAVAPREEVVAAGDRRVGGAVEAVEERRLAGQVVEAGGADERLAAVARPSPGRRDAVGADVVAPEGVVEDHDDVQATASPRENVILSGAKDPRWGGDGSFGR